MSDTRPAWTRSRRLLIKLAVSLLAIGSLTYAPFALLGLWNRVFGGWRSIFFCYAGSRNFISSYAGGPLVDQFRWRPSPIGVLSQGGARGLVLAAPVTEADFLDPANAEHFARLRRRLKRVAWLVGAERINMAGILPGVLRDDDIIRAPDTRSIVVAAVVDAIDEIIAARFGGIAPPVIVLGGGGYVGAPVTGALRARGLDCHVVDPKQGARRLPDVLTGRPALLLDISRHGVIGGYIPDMWPGLVVLNETFPRPATANTQRMRDGGVDVYHISGVAGAVTPPLPFGYENAVPCCAAHRPPERGEARIVLLAAAAASGDCAPGANPEHAPLSGEPASEAMIDIP